MNRKDTMKSPAVFYCYVCCCCLILAEQTNGRRIIWVDNVLGSPQEHASFSFVRPGLTQTSFTFNGPSSHQMFSASIGDDRLAQRVLPNIADALAYRNPGLGIRALDSSVNVGSYFADAGTTDRLTTPLRAAVPVLLSSAPETPDRAEDGSNRASSFVPRRVLENYSNVRYGQLGQLVRATSVQDMQAERHAPSSTKNPQMEVLALDENQERLEDRPESQSLLGIAFSSAPSVARVEATGNGYKFNF